MAANISTGTYISDGLRTGPEFNTSAYTNNGRGVLLSTQNSYNIYTSAPNPVGGFTVENNVVATTGGGGVNAGPLVLRGDNYVTFLTTGGNGLPLLQLDQPRVITVTTVGGAIPAGARVTIFGYDAYLFPMQHTYILNANAGKYPTFGFLGGANIPTMSFPGNANNTGAKAFYQVTGVNLSANFPAGNTISLGAADAFGLPYVINGFNLNNGVGAATGPYNSSGTNSSGVISSIQWGVQPIVAPIVGNANAIRTIGNLTTRTIGGQLDTVGYLAASDTTFPATATSGDVRGFYALPNATPSCIQFAVANTPPIINSTNLIFTYFIAGSDNSINQQASAQENYMLANNVTSPQGVPVPPLTIAETYGNPQFYTGNPS